MWHPRQQDVWLRKHDWKLSLSIPLSRFRYWRDLRGWRPRSRGIAGRVAGGGSGGRGGGPCSCAAGIIQAGRTAVDSQVGISERARGHAAIRAARGKRRGRLGGRSGNISYQKSRVTGAAVQAGDIGGCN